MAEIDRVYLTIEAHFRCYGSLAKHPEPMQKLTDALVSCVMGAMSRRVSTKNEDPKVKELVDDAMNTVKVLDAVTKSRTMTASVEDILKKAGWKEEDAKDAAKNPYAGQSDIVNAETFKAAAEKAMIARRSLYPLPGAQPWDEPRDPAVALRDDEDPYSFGIFDSIVEPIEDMLPPLYRLGIEAPDEEETSETT